MKDEELLEKKKGIYITFKEFYLYPWENEDISKENNDFVVYRFNMINNIMSKATKKQLANSIIVLEALKHGFEIKFIDKSLRNNRNIILTAAMYPLQWTTLLKNINEKFKDDKEIVLEVVKHYGMAVEYASERLKNDRTVAIEAIKQNGLALKYLNKFKNDKEIILLALRSNGNIMPYIDPETKKDNEISTYLNKHLIKTRDQRITKLINKEIGRDKEKVLKAFKDGMFEPWEYINADNMDLYKSIIEDINPEFLKDRYFMLKCIEYGHESMLNFADKELLNDEDFILNAIQINEDVINRINPKIINKEFVLKAISRNSEVLRWLDDSFKADKEIVLKAIEGGSRVLCYVDEELCKDKEIALKAVEKNGIEFIYVSEKLQTDKEVLLKAVENNVDIMQFVNMELCKDKEVILKAVEKEGLALKYASKELKANKDIVLQAVKNNGYALRYASEKIRADKEVVLKAIEKNGKAIRFANNKLKKDKDIMSKVKEYEEYTSENVNIKFEKEIEEIFIENDINILDTVNKELRTNKRILLDIIEKIKDKLKSKDLNYLLAKFSRYEELKESLKKILGKVFYYFKDQSYYIEDDNYKGHRRDVFLNSKGEVLDKKIYSENISNGGQTYKMPADEEIYRLILTDGDSGKSIYITDIQDTFKIKLNNNHFSNNQEELDMANMEIKSQYIIYALQYMLKKQGILEKLKTFCNDEQINVGAKIIMYLIENLEKIESEMINEKKLEHEERITEQIKKINHEDIIKILMKIKQARYATEEEIGLLANYYGINLETQKDLLEEQEK